VECVELDRVTEREWRALVAGEDRPWGAVGEGLQWREKDRYLGLRDPEAGLVAVAGAVIAGIQVEGVGRFEVVGIGSVFVTRNARGRGLVACLLKPLMTLAEEMGPELAMLFCRAELTPLYRRVAFREIGSPVVVEQPDRAVEMPLTAMWRRLRGKVVWPPGPVRVLGLPF
jgi:predicted GNAT family N-acyltransferase